MAGYYARSSFASAFHPIAVHDKWSASLSSPFQRDMVQADLTKLWEEQLQDTDFDLLLVDFIDERFHLAQLPGGGLATMTNDQ